MGKNKSFKIVSCLIILVMLLSAFSPAPSAAATGCGPGGCQEPQEVSVTNITCSGYDIVSNLPTWLQFDGRWYYLVSETGTGYHEWGDDTEITPSVTGTYEKLGNPSKHKTKTFTGNKAYKPGNCYTTCSITNAGETYDVGDAWTSGANWYINTATPMYDSQDADLLCSTVSGTRSWPRDLCQWSTATYADEVACVDPYVACDFTVDGAVTQTPEVFNKDLGVYEWTKITQLWDSRDGSIDCGTREEPQSRPADSCEYQKQKAAGPWGECQVVPGQNDGIQYRAFNFVDKYDTATICGVAPTRERPCDRGLCSETEEVKGEGEEFVDPNNPEIVQIVYPITIVDKYNANHVCGTTTSTETVGENTSSQYCRIDDPYGETVEFWDGIDVDLTVYSVGKCKVYKLPKQPELQACKVGPIETTYEKISHPEGTDIHIGYTSAGTCDMEWQCEDYNGWWASIMNPDLQGVYAWSQLPFNYPVADYYWAAQPMNDGTGRYFLSLPAVDLPLKANLFNMSSYEGPVDEAPADMEPFEKDLFEWEVTPENPERFVLPFFTGRGLVEGGPRQDILDYLDSLPKPVVAEEPAG